MPFLVALLCGAKTLGWDTQYILKMILETLGRFGLAKCEFFLKEELSKWWNC
jgi:hypothetical protein